MTAKDYLADAVRVSLRGAGALFKKGTEAMGGENIASVLVIEGAGKEAVQDKLWAKGKARNKDERAKYAKQLAKEFAEIKERLEQVVPTEAVKAAWKELVASAGEALEELNALADERFFLPGSLKARTKKRLDKVQALKERLVTKKTQAAALALDLARQVMALEKQRQDGVAQADKECKKLKKLLAGVMKKVDGAGGYETDLLADEMDADPERRSHFWRDLAKRCASEAGLKKAGAFLALVTMPIPVLSLAVAVAAGVAAVVTGVKKEVVENRAAAQALVGELNEVAFFVGRLGTATDPDSAVARFVDRFWKEAEVAMRSMTSLANQRKFKEWWTRSQNKAVIARANDAIRRSRENLRDSIAVDTNNLMRASHRRQVDEDEKTPERAGDFRPPPPAAPKGHFVRDAELAAMREKLGRAGEQGRVAVRGLAGSGKTWLARQFVRRHREEYDLTAWVDAETAQDARRNLADLGAFLELFAAEAAVDKAALTKGALERRKKPFLLVFNNVETWDDIKDLVPASAHCDLVFTVRNADVVPEQRSFELVVRGLAGDGARAVLLPEKDEEKEAAELAKVVGGLPLALAQLRAYKEMGSRTYGEVLNKVRGEQGCLPPGENSGAADVVLRLVVAGLSPEALAALQVLSVVGPERVPVSLLEVAGVAGQLAELRRLSLVHDGGRDGIGPLLDTHRLVQNMVRKDMLAEQRRRLVFELGFLVLVMSATFDWHDHRTWPATGRLEPHCRALLQQLPESAQQLRFRLWESLGWFYRANSAFEEAIGAYTEMRGMVSQNSVAMASTLGNMANVHDNQGAYDEAMELHEEALSIRKEALGERHPHVASTLGDMANVHNRQGAYDKAMALYEEALSIRKEALGERHPHVASTLGNMATVHDSLGAYDEAMALHEEALSITKEALGERHPHVASTLENMANVYYNQGVYDEAMALYEEALSIQKEALGERHPHVASTLGNMANVHDSQGAYDEAMELYEKALSIKKEALGERHPEVALTLGNMANVHYRHGAYDEAMALHEEALSIEKESLGERHPDVGLTLMTMAYVHYRQGAYDEAMALYEEALSIQKEALGERHPDVGLTLCNMAETVVEQQRPGFIAAAYGFLEQIDQKLLFGSALVDFHITSSRVLAVEGKAAESLDALDHAEAAADQFPANHPLRAEILNRRAEAHLTAVQPPDTDAAVDALKAAAVILSNSEQPDEHPDVALNKHLLGVALKLRGDTSGAREAFNAALRIRRACLPPGHLLTRATLETLASLSAFDQLRERSELQFSADASRGAAELYPWLPAKPPPLGLRDDEWRPEVLGAVRVDTGQAVTVCAVPSMNLRSVGRAVEAWRRGAGGRTLLVVDGRAAVDDGVSADAALDMPRLADGAWDADAVARLFEEHRWVAAARPGVRVRGGVAVPDEGAVLVVYVWRKGLMPDGEHELPARVGGLPVDVRSAAVLPAAGPDASSWAVNDFLVSDEYDGLMRVYPGASMRGETAAGPGSVGAALWAAGRSYVLTAHHAVSSVSEQQHGVEETGLTAESPAAADHRLGRLVPLESVQMHLVRGVTGRHASIDMDAALLQLDEGHEDRVVRGGGGRAETLPIDGVRYAVAEALALDELEEDDAFVLLGRTSGPVGFDGVPVRLVTTRGAARDTPSFAGDGETIRKVFYEQVFFLIADSDAAKKGDSGSLVFARREQQLHPVALVHRLVAVRVGLSLAVGTPIVPVLATLCPADAGQLRFVPA